MDVAQKQTKITFNIWSPLKDQLVSKMEETCLRRDAYLAKVLGGELEFLDQEVWIPNSEAAYDYVKFEFSKLKSEPMSLALPLQHAQRLKDICNRKWIYRDAFLNRLLLLLLASPENIDAMLFPEVRGTWRMELWEHLRREGIVDTSMFVPLATTFDPLWAYREALAIYAAQTSSDWVDPNSSKAIRVDLHDGVPEPVQSLYTQVFPKSLLGLSCYLPDRLIPGSAAAGDTAKLQELLSTML